MNSLWDILSVAIGVSFIFMILSILNSWLQEYIASIFALRATNLADILQNMLEPDATKLNGLNAVFEPFPGSAVTNRYDSLIQNSPILKFLRGRGDSGGRVAEFTQHAVTRLANNAVTRLKMDPIKQHEGSGENIAQELKENPVRSLYVHPIIYSLSKPGALPGYIPTNDFTVALIDLLNKAGKADSGAKDSASDKITMANIRKGIARLDGPLKRRLEALIHSAQINSKKARVDIEDLRNAVSTWFDDTNDRGKSWYKRKMQSVGIVCGLILAILLNADTIGLSASLWQNAVLRESVSQAAVVYAEKGDNANAKDAQNQLMALGLPIGWSFEFADQNPATPGDPRDFPTTPGGWISKSIGLLLTGFAISQGSQVWFDLMNRLINLRSSGLKPDTEEQPVKGKGG